MEAVFDNKNNVLNTNIRTTVDDSILYSITSTFGFRGKKITVIRDANPPLGSNPRTIVAAIYWHEKIMEIHGQKRKFSEIKHKEGKLLRKHRIWQWLPERKRYELVYHNEEWKANIDDGLVTVGSFSIPFRPHLFTKSPPPKLMLTPAALLEDELFLIMVFIYSESRRQDDTNSSVGAGSEGW